MKTAFIPLGLALLAATVLVAAGYGARFGAWDYRFGFQIVRWSLYAGLAIAALALVFLLIPRFRGGAIAALAAAIAIAAGVAFVPSHWLQTARAAAAINDITTDTGNPPAFVAILPLRAAGPVPAAYPGSETANAQRRAYPDIVPLELVVPPATAFARALDAATAMGWEVVAADAVAGRIEATATTPWFGFRDDVVVRVAPTPAGSRIDVRSVSRVGRSDLGANAKRIRAFLARLGHA
jgi:uncharacterized protein (DUF1499 family)